MVFYDLLFIYIFLPVCMLTCFMIKRPAGRSCALTLFSLGALAWGQPMGCVLTILSAAVNFLLGLGICRTRERTLGKVLVALGILFNGGILAVFRLSGAVHENFQSFPRLLAPLGLGYLTLRQLSYLEACRSGRCEAQRSFMRYMLYSAMFPTMYGGPVTPYDKLAPELERRLVTLTDFSEGMSRFIMGLGKKVILAERLGRTAGELMMAGRTTVLGSWSGMIVTMLWYYMDMSGWCDMAIGLGRIFGFHFSESFRYPFAARTIRGFLGRWNATVTEFFRTCVVKRRIFRGERRYIGAIIAFLLAALWYNATAGVFVTMLYFGLLAAVEMIVGKKRMKALPAAVGHIYTKLTLIGGFTLFTAGRLGKAAELFKSYVGLGGGGVYDRGVVEILAGSLWLVLFSLLISFPVYPKFRKLALEQGVSAYAFRIAGMILNILVLMVCSAEIAGGGVLDRASELLI